jgi:hypothetical protein
MIKNYFLKILKDIFNIFMKYLNLYKNQEIKNRV